MFKWRCQIASPSVYSLLMGLLALAGFATVSGCGGGNTTGSSGSTAPQQTRVVLLSTSTANDQLTRFNMVVNSLTLTGPSGASATVISTPIFVEFMHVNGISEPLFTSEIPQGTYTGATASIGVASFYCATLNSQGGVGVSDFVSVATPTSQVAVNLPNPITVSSSNTGLLLDLLVSKSASWTSCNPQANAPFLITPTFNLTSFPISGAPTSTQNGLESSLKGTIASMTSSNTFTVTADEGPSCTSTAYSTCPQAVASGPNWQVSINNNTVFDGISGAAELMAGMPVEMDAVLQPDGSLLATRVSVYDTSTTNLTILDGPLLFVSGASGYNDFDIHPVRELGPLNLGGDVAMSYGSASFHISGALSNLGSLPFSAAFGRGSVADGQNLLVTSHALYAEAAPTYVPTSSITLLPQTMNGTVTAISSDGAFTTYSVSLAPYDLFPTLAVQGGQITSVTEPSTVVVYADDNTQQLSAGAVAVGGTFRFYGLVMNDNGTLRMDCAQISDGVPE